MDKTYIVHPGYGITAVGEETSYIDGATLAALYGLDPEDYEIGIEADSGSAFDSSHIHLIPRPDGIYRNIKTELGDNGTDYHYRKMVNPRKWRKDNNEISDTNGYRT